MVSIHSIYASAALLQICQLNSMQLQNVLSGMKQPIISSGFVA